MSCDYKHLLWGYIESKKIWQLYNQFMAQFCHPCTGVNDFIDVFVVEGAGMICKVKTRLIQEMTQIVCLSGWTIENIKEYFGWP